MDKAEYLELAKKKGWDKKIPRLEDGTFDCDVFGGDDVRFDFVIHISGNLWLGNNPDIVAVYAGGDVVLGDKVSIFGGISASGDVIMGDNADPGDIFASGDITIGDNADIGDISADGDVTIGDNADTLDISAGGDVTIGDNADTFNISVGGDVTFGNE